MSISFFYILFLFLFLLYSTTMSDALIEKKEKKIEIIITTITTTTTTTKKKRSSKSRILNVYISINTALFIYNNKKTFLIMIEIWNLIWCCMKLVKIFIIAFTIIVFAILKLSFAFAKRIYIMLTSLNKYMQTIKRANQIKEYLYLILECDRKKEKEIENKIYLYIY